MTKKITKFVITLIIGLSILIPVVSADNGEESQGPVTTPPPIIPPGVESEALIIPHADDPENQGAYFQGTYLPALTSVIIGMAGGLAFLFIVIGGIQLLTAYGDEEKITSAKKTITYAIVGLLVAILSYAIVSIISGIQVGQTPQQQGFGEGLTEEQMQEKSETKSAVEEKVESGELAPGSEDLSNEEMQELLDD